MCSMSARDTPDTEVIQTFIYDHTERPHTNRQSDKHKLKYSVRIMHDHYALLRVGVFNSYACN